MHDYYLQYQMSEDTKVGNKYKIIKTVSESVTYWHVSQLLCM